jgi:hypothetical protein
LEPRVTGEPSKSEARTSTLDLIRKNPQVYFAHGQPSNWQFIAHIVEDASFHEARWIKVLREGDWCMVAADVDWMDLPERPVAELFDRFINSPQKGTNMFRAEVLVRASASRVWTTGRAGEFSHKLASDQVPEAFATTARNAARTIVWRLS